MSQGATLVTEATGMLGSAIIDALRRRGHHVLALVREAGQGAELRRRGVGVRVGSLTDLSALDRALEGVTQVVLVTGAGYGVHVDNEFDQGVNLIEAAQAASVEHIVFSSVASADRKTGVPHFDSKHMLEQCLRCCDLPFTILRAVFFMENFSKPRHLPPLQRGVLALPMRGDRPLQMISVADVGEATASAIEDPEAFAERTLELAGDQLTPHEAAAALSRAFGRPIRYEQLTEPEALSRFGPAITRIYRWLDQTGFDVDIPALRAQLPLGRFEEHLERAAWAQSHRELSIKDSTGLGG